MLKIPVGLNMWKMCILPWNHFQERSFCIQGVQVKTKQLRPKSMHLFEKIFLLKYSSAYQTTCIEIKYRLIIQNVENLLNRYKKNQAY